MISDKEGTILTIENVILLKGAIRSQSLSQVLSPSQLLSPDQIADIRLAASKMHGADRRAFQAEMTLKYCRGSARLSETVFGWKRQTVALGLEEKRTGIICVGAQSGFSGRKRWEEQQPMAAEVLRQERRISCSTGPNL